MWPFEVERLSLFKEVVLDEEVEGSTCPDLEGKEWIVDLTLLEDPWEGMMKDERAFFFFYLLFNRTNRTKREYVREWCKHHKNLTGRLDPKFRGQARLQKLLAL